MNIHGNKLRIKKYRNALVNPRSYQGIMMPGKIERLKIMHENIIKVIREDRKKKKGGKKRK